MKYLLSKEFTKIGATTGTIQNSSRVGTIEMSTSNTPDSGILIAPLQRITFSGRTIYLRCIDGWAEARVVDFVINAGGIITSNGSFDTQGGGSSDTQGGGSSDTQGGGGSSNPTDSYAQYLIVDSPFTTNLTDNCGVVWTPTGTVEIADGAAKLDNSYLRSNAPIQLEGQDFTISFDFKITEGGINDGYNAGIFVLTPNPYLKYNAYKTILYRYSNGSDIYFRGFNSNGSSTFFNYQLTKVNADGNWYNFEMNYTQEDDFIRPFGNGQADSNAYMPLSRQGYFIFLGADTSGVGDLINSLNGYFRNLKIYDGVALHSTNFTPN